jgi:hypothetical protein
MRQTDRCSRLSACRDSVNPAAYDVPSPAPLMTALEPFKGLVSMPNLAIVGLPRLAGVFLGAVLRYSTSFRICF